MLYLNQWAKAKTEFLLSSLATKSYSQALFLLLFFSTISQLGLHFWPEFSSIDGLRIDYLSPTLYFSDLVFFLLLGLYWGKVRQALRDPRSLLIIIPTLLLLARCFFQQSPLLGIYTLARLLQVVFIIWISTIFLARKELYKSLSYTISAALLATCSLGIFQWLNNGSLGGLWYLLGERTFNGSTPGIANASILGSLVLRPYAAFPHPNVLGGFILFSILLLLSFIKDVVISKKELGFFIATLIASLALLLLSLSRSAVGAGICVLLLFCIQIGKKAGARILLISGAIFVAILIVNPILATRFMYFSSEDTALGIRLTLLEQSLAIFKNNALFGVGLGEFLPELQKAFSPTFSLLQPVHNSFLLFITETGGMGVVLIGGLCALFLKQFKESTLLRNQKLLVLLALLFIGSFDHYFYSLQQGRLLLAFALGFLFTKGHSLSPVK